MIDALELFQSAACDFDRIFPRLFVDRQSYPRLAVDADNPRDFEPGILYSSNFSQLNGHTLADCNDRVFKLFKVGVLAWRPDCDLEVSFLYGAGWDVYIPFTNACNDSIQRDGQRINLGGVETDVNLALVATHNIDGCYARHTFEAILDLVFDNLPCLNWV